MKTIDVAAALSYVAGGSFAAAAIALSTAFPNDSAKILAFAAVVTPVALASELSLTTMGWLLQQCGNWDDRSQRWRRRPEELPPVKTKLCA